MKRYKKIQFFNCTTVEKSKNIFRVICFPGFNRSSEGRSVGVKKSAQGINCRTLALDNDVEYVYHVESVPTTDRYEPELILSDFIVNHPYQSEVKVYI